MIVCKQCGNQNDETDDFCGSCGGFLEFTGERIEEPAPPPPPPEEVVDLRPGFIDRVKDAVGIGDQPPPEGGAYGYQPDAPGPGAAGQVLSRQAQVHAGPAAQAGPSAGEIEAERIRREALRKRDEAMAAQAAAVQARRAAEAARRQEAQAQQAQAQADQARHQTEQIQAQAFPPRPGSQQAGSDAADLRRVETQQVEAARAAEQAAQARAEADRIRQEAEAEAARMRAEAEAEIARARRAAALVAPPQPVAQPAPPRTPGGVTAGPGPSVPGTPTARPPAAGGPGPGNPGNPANPEARQPVAVRPGEERARPKPVATQAPSRTINPGDLICGNCGEGNEPSRRFCRRCGGSLVEAVVAKVPWYRRLFTRKKKVVAAGERPGIRDGRGSKGKGTRGKAVKAGVFAAIALALVVAAVLKGPGLFETAKDKIKPTFVAVQPANATSPASANGHGPELAIDRISNSFWAEGAPTNGEGAAIEVRFTEPTDVARLLVTAGASSEPEEFTKQPRPAKISLVFDDGTSKTLTLEDKAEPQEIRVDAKDVTQMRLTIQTTYASLGGTDCSIAEIEFFQLKVGS